MGRTDIISEWSGTLSFAVISTARRFRFSKDNASTIKAMGQDSWDYVEIDNRGNKGATIFYRFNGPTASSTLASGVTSGAAFGSWRLPPDSIDRTFVRATSISVVSTSNATVVYFNLGRF